MISKINWLPMMQRQVLRAAWMILLLPWNPSRKYGCFEGQKKSMAWIVQGRRDNEGRKLDYAGELSCLVPSVVSINEDINRQWWWYCYVCLFWILALVLARIQTNIIAMSQSWGCTNWMMSHAEENVLGVYSEVFSGCIRNFLLLA